MENEFVFFFQVEGSGRRNQRDEKMMEFIMIVLHASHVPLIQRFL